MYIYTQTHAYTIINIHRNIITSLSTQVHTDTKKGKIPIFSFIKQAFVEIQTHPCFCQAA